MLLQANPESTLKHPVKKMETAQKSSDRAKEIAKSKEEMLSLLHDMPESDYELSLTDIVDKKSSGTDQNKEKDADHQKKELEKDRNLHKGIKAERKRSNSGKSLRCSSDGVLLNFYTPTSLTRSLTTPKTCKMMPPTTSTSIDYTKRENERILKFMGCWSLLWDRRGNKSKRQNQDQTQFEFHNRKEENSKSTKK
ncbi:hypothetical protein FCM35_KLT14531 [Carex littledalei]|uniref:Uncharacterized protein n=1 Tax=Carex littledalei TaxID=544730 RepID=A0A833QJU5_9POAL|nr:hypothetical protein FCM35_KLT14531 [Carex littledalei]